MRGASCGSLPASAYRSAVGASATRGCVMGAAEGNRCCKLRGVGAKADAEKGETAKAYVVLKPDEQALPEDIQKYCRDHLAAYKVPREVQIVPDLPTTSTGKILRRELHTLEESDAAAAE